MPQTQKSKLILAAAVCAACGAVLLAKKPVSQTPTSTDNPGFGDPTKPLGIRNSNPGNLRQSSVAWVGKLPADKSGFERFSSLDLGIRASVSNMLTAIKKHQANTVRKLVFRWAPPSENDSTAYVNAVAKKAIIHADTKINTEDADSLARIALAMFEHENGPSATKAAGIDLNRVLAVINKYNMV
jgi:hypothetical protein